MARSQQELQELLSSIEGVQKAYFQQPSEITTPCIIYERSTSDVSFADNIKYRFLKGYTVIVVDRAPDSLIPDQVEELPHTRFERFYRANGLNHYVFQLFF